MKNRTLKLSILMLLVTACAQKKEGILEVDPTTAAVESATTLVSGVADDQSGSSFAVRTPSWKQQAILPIAFASGCSRAVYNTCQSGVKTETYSSCVPGLSNFTLNGSVTLTYSNSTCDLSAVGSYVTRTYDLDLSGPHGGELSVSSATQSDYRGTSYGGGGKLTVTNTGWNLEILGKRKVLSFKNEKLFDVSVRTTAPLVVTGSLSRGSRVINSGQLEVNHNVAGFTGLFVAQNLQWSNACCHPISGSFNVTWSGTKTGSATVTFQGCGQASVNENGQTRNIELSYCE